MAQLSGLDATFLYLETRETPMHVGGLHLFERPADTSIAFVDAVRRHVANRLHLAPLFTRKLAVMPFDLAHPVWVPEPDPDLAYHIQALRLARPGTLVQLEALVARLHGQLMDRTRPLWQFFVIEGLKDGRIGFYAKVHHAAVDGQAGVALANAILDIGPEPRQVTPAERAGKRVKLGTAELLGAALSNQVAQYSRWLRMVPETVTTVSGVVAAAIKQRQERSLSAGTDKPPTRNWQLAPRTPLNVAITKERAFATVRLPLAEAKAVARAFEVTLNDVVLAVVSGALRAYLKAHKALPAKPLIGAVPVSLRSEGDTRSNNQVSMLMVNLASDIADPAARLMAINGATRNVKSQLGAVRSLLPTDYPSLGAPWLVSGLAKLYGRTRLANRLPQVANLVISNVPGPQFPLYLAGARMVTYHPVSIVIHGMALNVTVQSYMGSLDFGLIACRTAVPRLHDLVELVETAFTELVAAAREKMAPAAAAQAKPTRKAAAKKAVKRGVQRRAVKSTARKVPA